MHLRVLRHQMQKWEETRLCNCSLEGHRGRRGWLGLCPPGSPAVPSPEFRVRQTHRQAGRRGLRARRGRPSPRARVHVGPGGFISSGWQPDAESEVRVWTQSAMTTLRDVTHPQAHASPKEKHEAGPLRQEMHPGSQDACLLPACLFKRGFLETGQCRSLRGAPGAGPRGGKGRTRDPHGPVLARSQGPEDRSKS